jgi:hypothetical protein
MGDVWNGNNYGASRFQSFAAHKKHRLRVRQMLQHIRQHDDIDGADFPNHLWAEVIYDYIQPASPRACCPRGIRLNPHELGAARAGQGFAQCPFAAPYIEESRSSGNHSSHDPRNLVAIQRSGNLVAERVERPLQ